MKSREAIGNRYRLRCLWERKPLLFLTKGVASMVMGEGGKKWTQISVLTERKEEGGKNSLSEFYGLS